MRYFSISVHFLYMFLWVRSYMFTDKCKTTVCGRRHLPFTVVLVSSHSRGLPFSTWSPPFFLPKKKFSTWQNLIRTISAISLVSDDHSYVLVVHSNGVYVPVHLSIYKAMFTPNKLFQFCFIVYLILIAAICTMLSRVVEQFLGRHDQKN